VLCSNGWSADDVYSRLRDEEFAQARGPRRQRWRWVQSSGLSENFPGWLSACGCFPAVDPSLKRGSGCGLFLLCLFLPQSGGMALQVARLPGTPNLTAAVFARFLSIVYMTLAQLGVIFPGKCPPPPFPATFGSLTPRTVSRCCWLAQRKAVAVGFAAA
jgi:hypothetical protein